MLEIVRAVPRVLAAHLFGSREPHKARRDLEDAPVQGVMKSRLGGIRRPGRASLLRITDPGAVIRLGRFMSADWERRQGSRQITLGKARGRNTRNLPMLRGGLAEAWVPVETRSPPPPALKGPGAPQGIPP